MKLQLAPESSKKSVFWPEMLPYNDNKHALLALFTVVPTIRKLPIISFLIGKLVWQVPGLRWLVCHGVASNHACNGPFSHSGGTPRQPY